MVRVWARAQGNCGHETANSAIWCVCPSQLPRTLALELPPAEEGHSAKQRYGVPLPLLCLLCCRLQAGNNPGKGNEGSTSAEVLLAWLQMVGIGDDSDNEGEEDEEEEEEEGGEGEQQQGGEAEEEGADEMEEDGEQGVIDLEFEGGDGVEGRGGVDGEIGDDDMRLVVLAHR